jgi:ketosteroid isomerase-like protein
MMRFAFALITALITAVIAMPTAMEQPISDLPPALLEMADTERAFARRARETTVRQAFIDFFADEAIGFGPDPEPAREALRKQNRPQPPGFELHWEPRLGDIAASGDLGYLTGPAEYINPGKPNTYTCYFSVWKRQPDGEFRVILDVGIPTPEKTPFAPGLVRSPAVASWKGRQSRDESAASLMAADNVRRKHRAKGGQRSVRRRDARSGAPQSSGPSADDTGRRGPVARTRGDQHVEHADEGRNVCCWRPRLHVGQADDRIREQLLHSCLDAESRRHVAARVGHHDAASAADPLTWGLRTAAMKA